MIALKNIVFGFPKYLRQNLTAYDLFALTVVAMVLGHLIAYFYPHKLYPELSWFRLFDKALLPVFLVSVGFNAGRRIGVGLLAGALITSLLAFFLFGVVRVYVLGTIIIVKIILEPLMNFLLRNRVVFWSANLVLALVSYYSQVLFEFGTLALIFGIAGWINVNRAVIPRSIVTPRVYYIFAALLYYIFTYISGDPPFSFFQNIFFAGLLSLILWLLLDFRVLLMNSVKRKPKHLSGKIRHFLGHKSFEIYVIQHVFFFVLLAYTYG